MKSIVKTDKKRCVELLNKFQTIDNYNMNRIEAINFIYNNKNTIVESLKGKKVESRKKSYFNKIAYADWYIGDVDDMQIILIEKDGITSCYYVIG